MRVQLLIVSVLVTLLTSGLCFAQLTPQPQQVRSAEDSPNGTANPWENKKYELNSRILLQSGTTRGYLIVSVSLAPDSYIYSMSQAGAIPPTKFTVAPSNQFKLLGQFSADRPAMITEFDPIFKQQVERHHQAVQFFAPIEVAADSDPQTLLAQVTMNGQVCSKDGFCLPLRNKQLSSKFRGFFDRNATHQAAATSNVIR